MLDIFAVGVSSRAALRAIQPQLRLAQPVLDTGQSVIFVLAGASSVQAVSCWLAVHNSCEESFSAGVQTNNAGCLPKLAVRQATDPC